MRNGVCSQRPTLAPRTSERGSGSWGTPVARDDQKTPEAHLAMKARMGGGRTAITSLTVQAKAWPTPRASMAYTADDSASSNPNSGGDGLVSTAKNWPTPTAHDAEGQGFDDTNLHNAGLQHATTTTDGSTTSPPADLNPRFVEALMGVPPGWLTPCTSVETALYRRWLRLHSLSSQTERA